MKLQAHRGVSTEYPENTMPAFRAAVAQGYPIIELDNKFTADGVCVVHHDFTVNRTCRHPDGSAFAAPTEVSALTWEALSQLDAGSWFAPAFRGTRVPRMAEVLAFAKEAGVHIKIDNVFAQFSPELQEALFREVEESGADAGFTCADLDTLKRVVARLPGVTVHYDGPVDEETVLAVKALLKENPLVVWLPLDCPGTAWCKMPKATPELCAIVKKHATLGIWILHTAQEQAQAIALGADIVETTGALKP